ncbi:hypothetical protein C8J57DRAFT_1535231 [Mycena rebaudengoi]|nr:hypothetical protein C8J57DRAFT_1535231 [Mycena rebaudengoi]
MSSGGISQTVTSALALLRMTPTKLVTLLQQAFRAGPTAAKYAAILLIVLNVGSFPLMWHIRFWSVVFERRFALQWHKMTHFYLPKEKKRLALRGWYEAHLPIGVHPFRAVWAYKKMVGFDDADFNLHMSNSCYAKVLDSARIHIALATFPTIFRWGGWVALAAAHFHFIREIPMLTSYEVRISIGAWDGKWIWYVARFVKPPSKKSKSKPAAKTKRAVENGIASGLAIANSVASAADQTRGEESETMIPSLTTPTTPLAGMSGGTTPQIQIENVNGSNSAPDAVSRALLERAAKGTEPDGAVLYTVSVSQLCYKQGRITVPPALILASNGFYASPDASTAVTTFNVNGRSGDNKSPPAFPPHWPAVREVTQSMRGMAKFFAGGWRDVPEGGDGGCGGGRWWEEAFAACEVERKARLVPFVGSEAENGGVVDARRSGLSGGLEGVRGLAPV